jgi:hypothetical protein
MLKAIILGMDTEITAFSIDMETGEVGASITSIVPRVSIPDALQEIDKRKDIDQSAKEQTKAKVEELEDAMKTPTDKNRMKNLKQWFEKNAPYLKSVLDLINTILSKL